MPIFCLFQSGRFIRIYCLLYCMSLNKSISICMLILLNHVNTAVYPTLRNKPPNRRPPATPRRNPRPRPPNLPGNPKPPKGRLKPKPLPPKKGRLKPKPLPPKKGRLNPLPRKNCASVSDTDDSTRRHTRATARYVFFILAICKCILRTLYECSWTVLPAKSDSDVIFCLQLLSKTLTCTLHLS